VSELHIDRAYLSSTRVRERPVDLEISCKAWPVRNGSLFPKTAFHLDWEQQTLCCPNQQEMPFTPGDVVHFPAEICAACPLRDRCTTSPRGRSVSIHLRDFRKLNCPKMVYCAKKQISWRNEDGADRGGQSAALDDS
jgi:hypothetical protein